MVSSPDLRSIYIETLLRKKSSPSEGSIAFEHILAQCVSYVYGRVAPYLSKGVLEADSAEAQQIVQGLLSGEAGSILPSVQPYRRLNLPNQQLYETSPIVNDPEFLGFEATARAALRDGRVVEAGTMFWTNKLDHDRLDLAVLQGAVQLGMAINRHRISPIMVSTNATPGLLGRRGFAEDILTALQNRGFAPENFVLEILENNDLNQDTDAKIGGLRDLQAAGVQLAMDDLGRMNSEANLDVLLEEGVTIHEAKFDGQDTIQMLDSKFWVTRDQLLRKAEDAGAHRVVWEGFWKGFGPEVIAAVREYHAGSAVTRKWMSPIFEGTII